MGDEYVRVCPVCDTENAPAAARCACGASLAGIDFSLKRTADSAQPAIVEEPAHPHPGPPPSRERKAAEPIEAPLAASVVICAHADCAQPNPPGLERCIYCNRPLAPAHARPPVSFRTLPEALRADYRVIEALPVSGGEADLLLVAALRGGERRVAKLYRHGLEPDFRLLEILSQTVGDAVVRVVSHGISEGVAYELLEYVPGGTLEDLLQGGALGRDEVRAMVAEIAEALEGIHAHRILHRDLKPENVMVRSRKPLELALTDFGIASLSDATQHFTSGARTTKYAAPEVLTGVLDEKSDWWSLGMIALEAATGRHPFEGLTEHVMNHHLATRPIDVRGVYDDELRLLCRGLLVRDPKRRWSGTEVGRWLAGDTTLAAPEDTPASAVRPYRIGAAESTTAHELALALAKHWNEARKDLARGQIASWLEHELHDYNLVRKLRDITDHRALSDDVRLLRFMLAAAPDLPPVWRGLPVSDAAILDAARRAINGDAEAESWLDSLYAEQVLTEFAGAAHEDLRRIDRCWRESWTHFLELWNGARAAEEAWRKKPRSVAGFAAAEVVSYDDVMYGAILRLAPPEQRSVNALLLLVQVEPEYVAAMRGEVTAALGEIAGFCGWYEALWDKAHDDAVGTLVLHGLLKAAREDAAREQLRLGVSQDARTRIIAEAREALRERLAELLKAGPDEGARFDEDTTANVLAALGPFQNACARALSLGYDEPDCAELRTSAERLSAAGELLQRALARCEEVRSINAIFLRPERVLIAAAILLIFMAARAPWLVMTLIGAAAAWIAYRVHLAYRVGRHARTRWRALQSLARPMVDA